MHSPPDPGNTTGLDFLLVVARTQSVMHWLAAVPMQYVQELWHKMQIETAAS
jgi:hypothetical protein